MTMNPTRRTLLHQSTLLGGSLLASGLSAAPLTERQEEATPGRAFGDAPIRIALIGCGGRGRGATHQALSTAGDVRLVALADAFSDQLEGALATLRQYVPDRIDVPEERRFVGFDAYRHAIDAADLVILTTPPGFRPIHFEYAVSKGKHVFMEKPLAVDGPGVRRILAANEKAKAQGLKVGVGLQRHHSRKYQETVRRIQEGAIGKIQLLRAYWNSAGVWVRKRKPEQTEMEYQMRNWYYFNWLCGDHINEQHIHNLDVANWVAGSYPVSAQGQGGRQVRTGIDNGEIFDHHMVEFTYADGTKLLSQCRHQPGTWSHVNEYAHGTLGTSNIGGGRLELDKGERWHFEGEDPDPYQVEHDDLFRAVREGRDYNEADNGAYSTLTAILGRMATYSGKVVTWEQALNSELALVPEAYAWDAKPPTLPDENGRYPIPMPSQTRAF